MHNRRTFLTLAAAAPAATATAATASVPGSITIPIGPFATCGEPGPKTKREKTTTSIDGEQVRVEVSYVSREMTTITLWKSA